MNRNPATLAENRAVLRDLLAELGTEAAPEVAEVLPGLRIAGPWESLAGRDGVPTNPLFRGWGRRIVGHPLLQFAAYIGTSGKPEPEGRRLWQGWAEGVEHLHLGRPGFAPKGLHVRPGPERLAEAMALLDAHLTAGGWLQLPGGNRPCLPCGGYGRSVEGRVCANCQGDGADHDAYRAAQEAARAEAP